MNIVYRRKIKTEKKKEKSLALLRGGRYFSKITQQTTLIGPRPNTAPYFSEVGLKKFVFASELFVLRLYFIRHLAAKRPAKISWLPLQFIFRSGWLKPPLKREI